MGADIVAVGKHLAADSAAVAVVDAALPQMDHDRQRQLPGAEVDAVVRAQLVPLKAVLATAFKEAVADSAATISGLPTLSVLKRLVFRHDLLLWFGGHEPVSE